MMSGMNRFLEKSERFVLRLISRIFYRGKQVPKAIALISGNELNEFIFQGLMSDAPFMVARFGFFELEAALYPYICGLPLRKRYRLYVQKKITYLRYTREYAQYLMNPLCNNAGFFVI